MQNIVDERIKFEAVSRVRRLGRAVQALYAQAGGASTLSRGHLARSLVAADAVLRREGKARRSQTSLQNIDAAAVIGAAAETPVTSAARPGIRGKLRCQCRIGS